MIGLPEFGDLVRVYPFPGRRVQAGPRPVDAYGGGQWLSPAGRDVTWSAFFLEQYRAGDLLFHPPADSVGNDKSAPEPRLPYDPELAQLAHFDPKMAAERVAEKRKARAREEIAKQQQAAADPAAASTPQPTPNKGRG